MTESSLPVTDPKPQRNVTQSFLAANARKLAVLLVLLLSGCLGVGVKFWLETKATFTTLSLGHLVGSHEVRKHATLHALLSA